MRRARPAVLACLLLLAGAPAAAQTPPPAPAKAAPAQGTPAQGLDDVVRGLEGAYGRITDLKAEFSQTAFNKSLNQTIPGRRGRSISRRAASCAGSTREPTPQEIVSDGKTLWVYTPTLKPGERGAGARGARRARPAASWSGSAGCASTSACAS